MSEEFDQSVTHWICGLRDGQQEAAQNIWERFFPKLVQLADRRLGNAERRTTDHEDVAVSAFASLCIGMREGRFDKLQDRDDLWRLLVAIASHKAVDQVRRQTAQQRGGGKVRGNSVLAGGAEDAPRTFEQFISSEPTPELLVSIEETRDRLFARLKDDAHQQIAHMRLAGFNNQEIADKLDISVRSVERKLGLIRDIWASL